MKLNFISIVALYSFVFAITLQISSAEVGGLSGSVESSISAGSAGSPTWKIATASNLGDPVFIGAVSSVSANKVSFDTYLDESNATVFSF